MFKAFQKITISVLVILFVSACGGSDKEDTGSDVGVATITPVQNNASWWQARHTAVLAMDKSAVKLVFVGDSITHQWEEPEYGLPIWLSYFDPATTLNLGFDSDKTQHALWRMENGELDDMSPDFVVLMIGTNNAKSDSAEDIAAGIEAVAKTILDKLPNTTLILHRVFSRGDHDNPTRIPVDQASELANNRLTNERVRYLDINSHFEDENGDVPLDIMYDHIHLTTKGYQIWANAIIQEISQ